MSEIEQLLVENRVFPPPKAFSKQAAINSMSQYQDMCNAFDKDFEGTWARLAKENLFWKKPFTKVLDESKAPFYEWFADGTTNASYNCLDRNIKAGLGNKTALIFESDAGEVSKVSYSELHARVCQFANGLKSIGVKKGDRVVLYMAMSIEGIVAMQACARIGATHSVVFGGFSAKSLEERIVDVGATVVITADEQMLLTQFIDKLYSSSEALGRNEAAARRSSGPKSKFKVKEGLPVRKRPPQYRADPYE